MNHGAVGKLIILRSGSKVQINSKGPGCNGSFGLSTAI